jgi:hypothetical protein
MLPFAAAGGGCGVGLGLGWGWGIAIGAEYISVDVDFEESKAARNRPDPLRALQQQVRRVFGPKPEELPSHPIARADLPDPPFPPK